jgi:hypothetical protein
MFTGSSKRGMIVSDSGRSLVHFAAQWNASTLSISREIELAGDAQVRTSRRNQFGKDRPLNGDRSATLATVLG